MQFRFLAWYCWKQGLQVISMQNASVSIKSTKLNSSKVEASTISSSFTENHVLPNLSNWFFFCVNKFSKEFDFLHVLIYYVIKKQDDAFWHIYSAHEIPWTTYTGIGIRCTLKKWKFDSMNLVYNSMHLIFSTKQTCFL